MSPFEALYGFPPPTHIPYIPYDTTVEAVEFVYRDREAMINLLKETLSQTRNRMKQYADANRSERTFQNGDWVYLKLHPFVQNSIRNQRHSKIGPKYFGPFLVIEKIGKVAYKLDLPSDAQLHPVFHVSLLKKAFGQHAPIVPLPTDSCFLLQPRSIVDRRLVRKGNHMVNQVLVHWQGLPLEDSSWEDLNEFELRFPGFNS
ncbi:putative nucleotidyltransferase, Ribonuclease H [Helianthus annuus]|nr:putative nucleotidyltransferase, Ribonuclease H [Helianthus annuus]